MTGFEARVCRHLADLALPEGVGLVAVSGGPDSLALLHLLADCRASHRLHLVVGHVDHGIHPDSAAVARAVAGVAAGLGLPCHVGELGLGPGTSEGVAREARYRWLFRMLDQLGSGVVLTAHHRDDQVETILMRFLAGSGPAGLAAMEARRARLVRPLLPFSREEILAYVRRLGIAAWEDPANVSPVHLRSWLRREIVPRLRARLPDLEARVLAVGRQAGVDRRAWERLLDVPPLECHTGTDGVSVASGSLRAYDSPLAQALVAAVGRRAGVALGDRRSLRVLALARANRSGSRLELGRGWVAEVNFGRLVIRRASVPREWQTRLVPGTVSGGRWRITVRTETAPDRLPRSGWTTWLPANGYMARNWRPGDRIRPIGGAGGRLVVRCMQDNRVERRDRPEWPVILFEGRVVWVPGVCRSEDRIPAPGTESWRVDVERS